MGEILSYHVEYKELSPLIVQRCIKLYIEQFDPDRVYLLRQEVRPFLELTESQLNHIIEQYNRNDYSVFVALNELTQAAILRSREMRSAAQQELIANPNPPIGGGRSKRNFDYPANYHQLKVRTGETLLAFFNAVQRDQNFDPSDRAMKVKAFAFYERRIGQHEELYLPQSEDPALAEHYNAMHILKAMSRSLDAHSAYYSPEEAFDLRAALKKQFHGVGIAFKEGFDGFHVAEVVKGGSAERSHKIAPGDRLIAVDGESVEGDSFKSILEKMLGPENSAVKLTFERGQSTYRVKLYRERIVMDEERLAFEATPFADGVIGKITLPGFYDNGEGMSAEGDLREAIRLLKSRGPLYGLVIDMRENSGGFLTQAVKVASLFIDKGIIVISKYSDGEVRYFRELDGRHYFGGPVVIMTSKVSASATEIVAQALQDYGEALIVGDERTFGKGSMQYQTVTDDQAQRFYKVTVGRFYTVSGRSNQIDGVQADIVVPSIYAPYNIGERFLEYPLSNDQLEFSLFDTLNMQQKKAQRKKATPIPYMQRRETKWRKMLPKLQANSQERLKSNENFQIFLKKSQGKGRSRRNHGIDDLQMQEAVNIVKDMARIDAARQMASP